MENALEIRNDIWGGPRKFCIPPYNPFPFLRNVGVLHNEILLDLVEAFPHFDQSTETKWDFIITCVERKTRIIGLDQSPFPTFQKAQKLANNITDKLERVLDAQVKQGMMTHFVRDQSIKMLDIIGSNPATSDVNLLLSGFMANIAARIDVSVNDKIILISAAETGIFTSDFWNAALANDKHPYHKIANTMNESGGLRKIKWADLIGGVLGGVLGSSAGPAGAVTGAVALGVFASEVFGER